MCVAYQPGDAMHDHRPAGFRADIEGLRGIAVGAVVFYHALPGALPGGFLGVDVFFVISGYLITQLLVREVEQTGRIDLTAFWARRFRRIAPAAMFVLVAVALMSFVFPAIDGRRLGQHMTAAALSYYNWRQIAQGVDYLAASDATNPLLHYWSLSVEEQFYLAWPLALISLAGLRVSRRQLLAATALMATVSFAAALVLSDSYPPRAFFGTDARAWQLLGGALVAMAPARSSPRPAVLLPLVSAGIIGTCFLLPGHSGPISLLLPTAAAAAMIWAGAQWLGFAPLRYVGRVSFSWYLWHWPLIIVFGNTGSGLVAAVVLSFAAAVATFQFVEQPARQNRLFQDRTALACAAGIVLVVSAALSGFAMGRWGSDTVYAGAGEWISRKAVRRDRAQIFDDGCIILSESDERQPRCEYGRQAGPTVVLFGDSHAGHWFAPLEQAALARGWRLVVRVKAGCGPLADGRTDACERWRRQAVNDIGSMTPDLIIVSSSRGLGAAREQPALDQLSEIAHVVAVRDTPRLPQPTMDCLASARQPADCSWRVESIAGRTYPSASVDVLDFTDRICPHGVCSALADRWPVFFDGDHLTRRFSMKFEPEFDRLLAANAPVVTGSTR
jgi:peptidoglycan/LPS O-acetylase OafA/YrhL